MTKLNWNSYTSGRLLQFSSCCLVVSNSLLLHWPQHARPPCPSPTPRAYSNSCPLSQWCHPTFSYSAVSFFSWIRSSPASGSIPMSQFFAPGWQSIGDSASTSHLLMKSQDWLPLGLTGLNLQSKGSQESSPTPQFKSINSSVLSFFNGPTFTSIQDCWKNQTFDQTDFFWQSNVSAF